MLQRDSQVGLCWRTERHELTRQFSQLEAKMLGTRELGARHRVSVECKQNKN